MKLLRLAPENTKFDFMRLRRVSYPMSAILSIVAVLLFFFVGMNFGIDFSGGTQVELRAKSGAADIAALRSTGESLGLGAIEVQRAGADTDAVMRVGIQPGGEAADLPGELLVLQHQLGEGQHLRLVLGVRVSP